MKVLITGSRDWTKRGPIQVLLGGFAGYDDIEFVFGDCPTGVDAIALQICKDLGYPFKKFDADWNGLGKAAGPTRNGLMVMYCIAEREYVCYGIRSNGVSRGTDDCMEQARQAGMPVYCIRNLPKPTGAAIPGTKGYRYNSAVEGP